MISRIFIFISLFLSSLHSWGQVSPMIVSGRPGQSIGAGVAGQGMFQIQSGYDHSQVRGTSDTDTSLFNNVIRLGLSKDFELSAVLNHQNDLIKTAGTEQSRNGISGFHLGFRSRIIDQADGLIPALAIQTRFKLDAVNTPYRSNDVAPIVTIAAVHNLCDNYSHTLNLGVSYDGNTSAPTYFWTSNVAHSINDSWGIFIEGYGNIKNNIGTLNGDTGFEYFVHKDLKADFSLGGGNNNGVKDTFVSVGLSWRTDLFSSSEMD